MYLIFVLHLFGYLFEHLVMVVVIEGFEGFFIYEEMFDGMLCRLEVCQLLVWDICFVFIVLFDIGSSLDDFEVVWVVDWLLVEEIRVLGDWVVQWLDLESVGWVFEFVNDFYFDVDDIVEVVMVLCCVRPVFDVVVVVEWGMWWMVGM